MTDPKIKLGDTEYVIPKLAIKQNKHVEPLVAKHLQFFLDAKNKIATKAILQLTEQEAEDFTKIVYYCVTRGKPELTWEQFEALPLSMKDIMLSLPTCVQQSGLFTTQAAAGGNPAPGEAPSPLTGTGS